MTARTKSILIAGIYFTIAALCLRAFFDAANFHSQFKLVLGVGTKSIPDLELVYSIWYMFLGSLAALALALGFQRTSIPTRLQAVFETLNRRDRWFVFGLTGAVFLLAVFFRVFVLLDAPVADDESTYMFIAQTLQHGRIVNPIPEDPEFFTNQFVVMNRQGWFGKYPIGHPLLLAAADLVGGRFVVGPLLACLSLLLTYAIGKKIFGAKTAALALLLLAASPHFLLTGATLLSQTTATLFLLLAMYFAICFLDQRRTRFGVLTGLSLAYGILVRPFPGIFFLVAVFVVVLLQANGTSFLDRFRASGRGLFWIAIFASLAGAALLLINRAQTGALLTTAYHEFHGPTMGVLKTTQGQHSMSVAAALLRQNLWLFGWPVSLLFIGFLRRNRYLLLLAALVIAEYLYRVVFPKTVVSSTGPIYVTEIVPLLALASASGIDQVRKHLKSLGVLRPEATVISLVAAFTVVALLGFWPAHLIVLNQGARAWRFPYRALAEQHVPKALVFADTMVDPTLRATWAFYPPSPTPSMDDDIVFVRTPRKAKDPIAVMREFHQRRYPGRPAFTLRNDSPKSQLVPLWPSRVPPSPADATPGASPP